MFLEGLFIDFYFLLICAVIGFWMWEGLHWEEVMSPLHVLSDVSIPTAKSDQAAV